MVISDRSIFKLMEVEGDWQLFAEYSDVIGNTKPINYIIQNAKKTTRNGDPVIKTFKTLSSARNTFNKLKYT